MEQLPETISACTSLGSLLSRVRHNCSASARALVLAEFPPLIATALSNLVNATMTGTEFCNFVLIGCINPKSQRAYLSSCPGFPWLLLWYYYSWRRLQEYKSWVKRISQTEIKEILTSILYQTACSLSRLGHPGSVRRKMKSWIRCKFLSSPGPNPGPSWKTR